MKCEINYMHNTGMICVPIDLQFQTVKEARQEVSRILEFEPKAFVTLTKSNGKKEKYIKLKGGKIYSFFHME